MNTYTIRVNNAIINASGRNEYAAIRSTGLFTDVESVETVKLPDVEDPVRKWAFIYAVELNGIKTLAFVKREEVTA